MTALHRIIQSSVFPLSLYRAIRNYSLAPILELSLLLFAKCVGTHRSPSSRQHVIIGTLTNKFYAEGAKRGERVKDLFAAVAPRYDLINDLQSFGLHRYWKRRLLALSKVKPNDKVLDVCCGTGDVALAFAHKGAEVVGIDFSEPMLAVAEKRLPAEDQARFLRGDAQNIEFPDATFDVVTISYGLRNLADMQKGLQEMARVLKPNGRILILDFGKPDNAWLRGLYFFYLKHFVPLMGRYFCGDPETHAYILESLLRYAAQKGVDAKLRELRFRDTRIINFLGGVMSLNYAEKS